MLSFKKKLKLKIKKIVYRNSLRKIAECVGGDKLYGHNYIPIYENYFKNIRKKNLKILEIGVGGYDNPTMGGESLYMWSEYFPDSKIIGADLFEKKLNLPNNVIVTLLDQSSENQIESLGKNFGPFDIIIDDGSHISSHVIKTFEILFKNLRDGGFYIIEDTQTAYWTKFGGDDTVDSKRSTYFFKNLTDGLNYQEYLKKEYIPSEFDKYVKYIHFYHNIIVINKGNNESGSLFVKNGKLRL